MKNTKHSIILMIMLFSISLLSQGQKITNIIKPHELNGYLLIHDINGSPITNWELKIVEKIHDSDNTITEKTIHQVLIQDQEYMYIPKKYYDKSKDYVAKITNFNQNGSCTDEIEVDLNDYFQPDILPYHANTYVRTCNSPQYAYQVSSNNKILSNGNISLSDGYLDLVDPYKLMGTNAYYIFYTEDEYTMWIQTKLNQFCVRHDIHLTEDFTINEWIKEYGKKIEHPTMNDSCLNWDGQPVPLLQDRPIVGIRKDRGVWRHQTKTTECIGVNSIWNIDMFSKKYSENIEPPLTDESQILNENSKLVCRDKGKLPKDPKDIKITTPQIIWTFKYGNPFDINVNEEDEDGGSINIHSNIYDVLTDLTLKLGKYNDNCNYWPANLDYIQIFKLNGRSDTNIMLKKEEVINKELSDLPTFNLEKGLYRIRYFWNNSKYDTRSVFEVERTVENTINKSSLFNISIYPVPIVNDDFKISITGNIEDIIIYELFDSNGNLIYETKIDYNSKNEILNLKINIPNITDGILLNRFSFSDNSTKTIQTLK